MTEKRKNDVTVRNPASPRIGAIILITIGVLFLLMNTGVFSFSDIGEFFGNFGRAFGEFFGNLGRSIATLWPLALILIGVGLLFWRRPNRQEE